MGIRKYTFQNFYDMAMAKGFEIISTEKDFKGSFSKMKYICPKHRDFGIQETTLGRLLEGKGCMYCGREATASKRRKAITEDMVKKARDMCIERNFTFISMERKHIHRANKICVNFVCNLHKDKGVQCVPINNFKRNQKCQYCQHKNLSKDDIQQIIEKAVPQVEVLSDYSMINDRVNYRCRKHNYFGQTTPANLIKGKACYYCGLEKLSNELMLSTEEVDKRIYNINPSFKRISEYHYSTEPMTILCKKCGFKWNVALTGLRYCPNCEKEKLYKGEHIIFEILQEKGIAFETQKRFEDCKNTRCLPFDFFLPKYNVCIEYNGIQHYEPVDYFGGIESFNQRQINDKIKRDYCLENKIRLLEIPYTYNTKSEIQQYIFQQL